MPSRRALIGLTALVLTVTATAMHSFASSSPLPAGRSAHANAAGAPWPMFGHDARHTGRSSYVGPAWPRLKWRYQIGCCGEVRSSPVISSDGIIYIGSSDGSLYAIRPDGTLAWKYASGCRMNAPPAVEDDTICISVRDCGAVLAIRADGSLRWRFSTEFDVPLTIGSNGSIYALNSQLGSLDALALDGTLLWRFEVAGRASYSPAEDANRGRVYVASASGDLCALSREGVEQWRLGLGARPSSAPTIADDGTVYVSGTDSRLRAVSPEGVLLWSCPVEAGITTPPALGTDGTILVGSTTGCTAIGSDGTPTWQSVTLGSIYTAPAVGADGTLYVGANNGKVYALSPDGIVLWQFETGDWVASSAAIGADGTLYVGSDDGYIYAIENAPNSTPTIAVPTPVPTVQPLDVIAMPDRDAWIGNPVLLWGRATGDSVGLPYEWSFGDGMSARVGTVTNTRDITATHAFDAPGIYNARLTVGEANNLISDGVEIHVYDQLVVTDVLPIEVNVTIEEALHWLYLQQDQQSGAWSPSAMPIAHTSEAVLAFEVMGHLPDNDPQSDVYVDTVRKGLDFLLSRALAVTLEPQPAGNPDANGNGLGIAVCGRGQMYEAGMFVSALAGSWAPSRTVTSGPLSGRTYAEVMQDCVDYFAYAQSEAMGGWRYAPNGLGSDNSVSQWPVLGLLGARLWAEQVTVPSFVAAELERWVSYIQSEDGGSGYLTPGLSNVARTGSLLVEMAYLGDDMRTARVRRALGWLGEHWNAQPGEEPGEGTGGNKGNLYAMYGVKRGLTELQVRSVPTLDQPEGLEWYRDYAVWLLQRQEQDGRWQAGSVGENQDDVLTTAWALLILEPTTFGEPPPRPPIVQEFCCCAGDPIYHIDLSQFYGYHTRSASESALIRVTSPPAPVAWNLPSFLADASWQPGREVWWDAWRAPGWGQQLAPCRPIGLVTDGEQQGQDGATHLYRHTFVLSPPESEGRMTSAVLEMWSDNKTEWWWQGRVIKSGREGYLGWVELLPGDVDPLGGTYVLAVQNSNDRTCPGNCNAHATACRLRVTWSFPGAKANALYLPLIMRTGALPGTPD